MTTKHSLQVQSTSTHTHFYLESVFLLSVPNELANKRGYRYEGSNGCGHFDAYLQGNKVYVTLKFLDDNNRLKSLKTHHVVPRKRLTNVMNALAEDVKQVAEE